MPLILEVHGKSPKIHESCFVAENSTIVGDVTLGEGCSVWFNAIIRGDVNSIRIGNRVNIQDGAVVHCTYEKASTNIGNNVSIGHNAIVHGCELKDNVLIGMGAIVMDNAIIRENVIIAAGAVVLESTDTESGWIYAGTPAKKVKKMEEAQINMMIQGTSDHYVTYIDWFK